VVGFHSKEAEKKDPIDQSDKTDQSDQKKKIVKSLTRKGASVAHLCQQL